MYRQSHQRYFFLNKSAQRILEISVPIIEYTVLLYFKDFQQSNGRHFNSSKLVWKLISLSNYLPEQAIR